MQKKRKNCVHFLLTKDDITVRNVKFNKLIRIKLYNVNKLTSSSGYSSRKNKIIILVIMISAR